MEDAYRVCLSRGKLYPLMKNGDNWVYFDGSSCSLKAYKIDELQKQGKRKILEVSTLIKQHFENRVQAKTDTTASGSGSGSARLKRSKSDTTASGSKSDTTASGSKSDTTASGSKSDTTTSGSGSGSARLIRSDTTASGSGSIRSDTTASGSERLTESPWNFDEQEEDNLIFHDPFNISNETVEDDSPFNGPRLILKPDPKNWAILLMEG